MSTYAEMARNILAKSGYLSAGLSMGQDFHDSVIRNQEERKKQEAQRAAAQQWVSRYNNVMGGIRGGIEANGGRWMEDIYSGYGSKFQDLRRTADESLTGLPESQRKAILDQMQQANDYLTAQSQLMGEFGPQQYNAALWMNQYKDTDPQEIFNQFYDTQTEQREAAPVLSNPHDVGAQRVMEAYQQAKQDGQSQAVLDNYLNTFLNSGGLTPEEAREIREWKPTTETIYNYTARETEDTDQNRWLRDYLLTPDRLTGLRQDQRDFLMTQLDNQYSALIDEADQLGDSPEDMERFKAINREMTTIDDSRGFLNMANNLAEREAEIGKYESVRSNPDFQGKAETASWKNWGQDDQLGLYLEDPETYLSEHSDARAALTNSTKWEQLEQAEIDTYYYLLETEGQKVANEYLDAIDVRLGQRAHNAAAARTKEIYEGANGMEEALMNLNSIPGNVFGGIGDAVDQASHIIRGEPINPYSLASVSKTYAETVRGESAEDILAAIGEEHPVWGQIAANTYQAVMSGADSAFSMLLFGKGATATMAASAASDRAKQLYEAGASDVQVGLGAVTAGAIEWMTEKYSVDYFMENFMKGDKKGFFNTFLKVIGSGLTEASEETASFLANQATDALQAAVFDTTDEAGQDERALMIADGLTQEQAAAKVTAARAIDLFWSAYGGFISGAGMGTGGAAINAGIRAGREFANRGAYREAGTNILANGSLSDVVDAAADLPDVDAKLLAIAKQKATAAVEGMTQAASEMKDKTVRQLGKFYTQVQAAQAEKAKGEIKGALEAGVAAVLKESGAKDDVDAAAALIAQEAAGEGLTAMEENQLRRFENENNVDREIMVARARSSQEFRNASEETMRQYTEAAQKTETAASGRDAWMNPRNVADRQAEVQEAAAVYADPAPMTAAYMPEQDAQKFADGWANAFEMGKEGIELRYALRSSTVSELTENQILTAYEEGRKAEGYEETDGNVRPGEEWNDRAAPGEPAPEMEALPGSEEGTEAAADGAEPAAAGQVRRPNIPGCVNLDTLEEVEPSQYNQEGQAAAKIAKDNGLNCVIVKGGAIKTTEESDGEQRIVRSRALIVGDTMYIRSDDPLFPASQIARHEAGHEQIRKGEVDVEQTLLGIRGRYSQEQIDQIAKLYADAYGNSGLSAAEIMEEIVCDALGEMNAFAVASTETVAGEVGVFLRNVKRAATNLSGSSRAEKSTAADGKVKIAFEDAQNKASPQYSREMDTVRALEKQNKLLKERAEYWKGQAHKTKTKAADPQAVKKWAMELIGSYGSRIKSAAIAGDLQWIADKTLSPDKEVGYLDLATRAEDVARRILEGAEVNVNADMEEDLRRLKQVLRSQPINMTEQMLADFPDFKDFKKQNRPLRFREDGSGTDMYVLWLSLQDEFGAGMFPESVQNPMDQIQHVAERLSAMQADMRNPYAASMDLTVKQVSMDILNGAYDVDPNKPTRVDKAIAGTLRELETTIREGRARERGRIERNQATQLRQQIRNLSNQFERMANHPGKGATQHAPVDLLKSVVAFCQVLNDWETSRQERIRGSLVRQSYTVVRKFVEEDLSPRVKDEYHRLEKRAAWNERALARLQEAKQKYASLEEDGRYALLFDEAVDSSLGQVLSNLTEILKRGDMDQLSSTDLEGIYRALKMLHYTITNANKAFSMGQNKQISEMARKLAGEMKQVNHKGNGLAVMSQRFWQWQMSPDVFFDYICGYIKDNEGKVIQKAFAEGTTRSLEVQRLFYETFRQYTESQEKDVQKELRGLLNYNPKEMVEWGLKDLDGNEVKTTRGMMLQAYMLLQQKASRESLGYGGFSVPRGKEYYTGNISAAYGDQADNAMISQGMGDDYMAVIKQLKDIRYELENLSGAEEGASPEGAAVLQAQRQIQLEQQERELVKQAEEISMEASRRMFAIHDAIEKQLTPLEKQLIETAHEWYSKTGDMMKDVYSKMYGFEPRTVENYVPIHRDLASIQVDIRNMADAEKAFNLENSGFTIARVKSFSPILLTDFFVELEGQKTRMARYVGFAQVQKDFGKIWKYRLNDRGMTVNKMVQGRFGSGKTTLGVSGEEYINHYIADVAGGHKSDDLLGKFYGNYAAAVLSFNPRVAASQLSSIPKAASVVGWKAMAKGVTKGIPKAASTKAKRDLASKNAWFYERYRGEGGISEIADMQDQGGAIKRIADSKWGKRLFNWCQNMDVFATGPVMWEIARAKVEQDGLKEGMEGYEEAINRAYTDIIRISQSNSTVTERSDFLRDKRGGIKLLTMFKTESNQSLNILMAANGEFIRMKQDFAAGRNGVTKEDVQAAREKLANCMTSVVIGSTAMFITLRTLTNFILGAVNAYRDEETEEVTLAGVLKSAGKEAMSSIFGMIALGGPIYDIILSSISGDKYYGLSDSAISSLSDAATSSVNLLQAIFSEKKDVTGKLAWKAAESIGMCMSIPMSNGKKVYDMIAMYAKDIQNGTLGAYTSGYETRSNYEARVAKYVTEGNEKKAGDALAMLWAMGTGADDAKAQAEIVSEMRKWLKDRYMTAEYTDTEAEKILSFVGDAEPGAAVTRWDFMLAFPELKAEKATEKLARLWSQRGNIDEQVLVDAYLWKQEHNRKAEVVEYIQGLKISAAQKKQLWNMLRGEWVSKGTPWE